MKTLSEKKKMQNTEELCSLLLLLFSVFLWYLHSPQLLQSKYRSGAYVNVIRNTGAVRGFLFLLCLLVEELSNSSQRNEVLHLGKVFSKVSSGPWDSSRPPSLMMIGDCFKLSSLGDNFVPVLRKLYSPPSLEKVLMDGFRQYLPWRG